MLSIKEELLLDRYAQGLAQREIIVELFNSFSISNKKNYLEELIHLIKQSKPQNDDIVTSIKDSNLKGTYTPCVMLKKGIESHLLRRMIDLPQSEYEKVLILFLSIFKVAYLRRFEAEKNDPNKWWYWDLSDKNNVEAILQKNM